MRRLLVGAFIGVSVLVAAAAHAASSGALRAGAAKVDITPPRSALRAGDRIRDGLFVRALVIGNPTTCAVLVGLDQVMLDNVVVESAITRSSAASGCPAASFVVSATHAHSASTRGIEPGGEPNPKRVEEAIVSAVTRAAGRMQPARIGFGTADVHLNVNRDLFTENQWMQGSNPRGVSDKTLAVIDVLGADDRPIGVYLNYAMHPISFYLSGVISADVPGEASRYIERRYGPEMVAIFAQGAAGDQNPLLTRPLYRLVANRTGSPSASDTRLTRPAPWLEMARERNANNRLTDALSGPVPKERLPGYEAAIQDQSELVTAMGAIIGETALDVMRYKIQSRAEQAAIRAASAEVQCPGRDRSDRENPVREGSLPPYGDGAPVLIRESVLRLGDTYIVAIDGEAYSEIGLRLKREAPVSRIMMTTLANGLANSGYIYSDEAASHLTFQVIGSRLKPGCAERKIVNMAMDLIPRVQD